MGCQEHPPRRHESPIASLLRIFKLTETTIETITPVNQLPAVTPKLGPNYTTQIQDSRKKSINAEKNDQADFKVYSDGSGYNGGI
jgi:hypothetical protein